MRQKRTARGRGTAVLAVVAVLAATLVVAANQAMPAQSATPHKAAISLAGSVSSFCAATDEAEVWCWGTQTGGDLADGVGGHYSYESVYRSTPGRSQADGVEVTATCARTSAGAVRCWGSTAIADGGDASWFNDPPWASNTPIDVGFAPAVEIEGRCVRSAAGTVQCQGFDNYGQTGSGGEGAASIVSPTPPMQVSAVSVSNLTDAVSLGGSDNGVCASKADGTVVCWGHTGRGQLGDGFEGQVTVPCRPGSTPPCTYDRYSSVPAPVQGITDAVRAEYNCALRTEGRVSCWGSNGSGQISIGGAGVVATTEMPALQGSIDLDRNRNAICGVLDTGVVRCQGGGALPDGTTGSTARTAEFDPVEAFGSKAVQVAASLGSWCIGLADGRVACWGTNRHGDTGTGTASGTEVAVPSLVVGFGAELDEDDLTVEVALDPDTVTPEMRVPGEPSTVDATITVRNGAEDPVTNVTLRDLRISRVFAGQGLLYDFVDPGPVGPGAIAVLGPPDNISGLSLPDIDGGESLTLRARFTVETPGAFEVRASVWAKGYAPTTVVAVGSAPLTIESGLGITLEGGTRPAPGTIDVTVTIVNTSGEKVDVTWPEGLVTEVLAGSEPLRFVAGPTPDLPTSIDDGASVEVRWRFEVAQVGTAVFTLAGVGETESGLAVESIDELSVEIDDLDVQVADAERALLMSLDETLDQVTTTAGSFDDMTSDQVREATANERARAARIASYREAGYGETSSAVLADLSINRDAAERYLVAFAEGQEARALELGDSFSSGMESFAALARDPEKRGALASAVLDGLRTNGGYLADALTTPTPLALRTSFDGLKTAGSKSATALWEAGVGQAELWRIDAELWRTDRQQLASNAGTRHGRMSTDVGATVLTELVTEGATAGTGRLVSGLTTRVGKGLTNLRRASSAEASAAASAAVSGGDDAFAAASRDLARAEVGARYGDLPYGMALHPDDVADLGGFSVADQQAIDAMIAEVKAKWGVDIQVVARTAEPLSNDVPLGVGKQSFTKEKAVGGMDLQLGAPEVLSGRVSIFEPKPLPQKVIDAMEMREPGWTARYEDRLQTQKKNWVNYHNGTSKTAKLVEGSARHPGGVTVLNDLPGDSVDGLMYLEQALEPEYQQLRGWSQEQAADVYQRLSNHRSATRTKLEVTNVDGALTLTDSVSGTPHPVVSDYDIQGVRPVGGGSFPMGTQGPIETFVKRKMDAIGRSGRHGWSESAFDLPAANFDLAAEYIMTTAHPSVADAVADNLAKRFSSMAREFKDKAAALPTSDPRRAELLAVAERYEGYTKDELLKKWPPGEKTIVFTRGRVDVGSGEGTP